MRVCPDFSFNLHEKKQILAFQLLAMLSNKKRKPKSALKAVYSAQTIVAELDEAIERNLDYLLAVNTLTAYLLLLSEKPRDAVEFIDRADIICQRLLDAFTAESINNSIQLNSANGSNHNQTMPLKESYHVTSNEANNFSLGKD